jgi:hypothetical protein
LQGGNLASIHSKAENDFVSNLVPSTVDTAWIGASDEAKEVIYILVLGKEIQSLMN